MGLELPMVSAAVARLDDPKIHLAAYGGVVFPVALLIESPVIMLLSASTALARDHGAWRVVRRFMWLLGGGFTLLHALVAFTPLYDLVVVPLMAVPEEVREPGRWGLRIMLPWTLSIAYRRCQQGVLIRHGHSRAVGVGTAVRLLANAVVLGAGLVVRTVPGIVVGAAAVAAGVVAEAVYAGIRVRPVLRDQLPAVDPAAPPLIPSAFLRFYLPLLVMPFFVFLAMPLTSAAISRMPSPLESLAAWPAMSGLVFALRSTGFALNEVVVAMLGRPGAARALRSFGFALAGTLVTLLLVMAFTPLGRLWFERVAALPADLVGLAAVGLALSAPMPGLSALQSLYQGALIHGGRTRAVTESVVLLLFASILVLGLGVATGRAPGLWFGAASMVVGNAVMVLWLRLRATPVLRALPAEEAAASPAR
jgi:hypothetical protein